MRKVMRSLLEEFKEAYKKYLEEEAATVVILLLFMLTIACGGIYYIYKSNFSYLLELELFKLLLISGSLMIPSTFMSILSAILLTYAFFGINYDSRNRSLFKSIITFSILLLLLSVTLTSPKNSLEQSLNNLFIYSTYIAITTSTLAIIRAISNITLYFMNKRAKAKM